MFDNNVISMENRRKYKYIEDYQIETFKVAEGDTIILHLNKNLDVDDINSIHQEIQQLFPKNTVICANECILSKITILKKDEDNPFLKG